MTDLLEALRAMATEAPAPQPKADEPIERLRALLIGTSAPTEGGVIRLKLGETRRSEGFDSEAEYLAAQRARWSDWMRMPKPSERFSHLRWTSRVPVTFIEPTPKVKRQRRAQKWANAYCPNLILGS